MSTYTDYKCERKENITILRKPNCPEFDGFTPQKVIFGNEANIFKGTFQGKVIAQDMALSGVEITDCTINGGVLLDTCLCSDGEVIQLSDLTSQVSQFGTDLYDTLCSRVSTLESNFSNSQTNISKQLSGLSTEIIQYTNELIETSCEYISTELTNAISGISTELTTSINSVSTELTNTISSVSSELTTSINTISTEITSNINTISTDLSNEIIDRISGDTYISSNLSTLSNEFINHVEQNKEDFKYLTEYMLSTVEHDKHYQFYYSNNIISSVPYKLHDFGINIVQDVVNNAKLIYKNVDIGYATKFNNGNDQFITVYINSKDITDFNGILPPEYCETIQLNGEKQIKHYSELYFITYNINENGTQSLTIQSNAKQFIKVFNKQREWIGSIVDYTTDSIDPFRISKGVLNLRYNQNVGDFNIFYDTFKSISFSNTPDGRDTGIHGDLNLRISFDYDNQTFTFERNVSSQKYKRVFDNIDGTELGIIYEDECTIVNGIISSFIFNGGQDFGNAVLTENNNYIGFTTVPGYIIKLSTDNITDNIIEILSAERQYEYTFNSDSGSISGVLIPANDKTLFDADSNISVSITASINSDNGLQNITNTKVLTKTGNIWKYEDENINIVYENGLYGSLNINGNIDNVDYSTTNPYIINLDSGVHTYHNAINYKTSLPINFDFTDANIKYASLPKDQFDTYIDNQITNNDIVSNLDQIIISDIPEDDQYVQYEIPTLENIYNDCSREFIIASNIKSNSNVKIKFFDINKQQITNISSDSEVGILTQPANKLVVMKINEVEPNGFFVTYITHDHLLANISKLSSDLSIEISNRISSDEYLSTQFDIKLSDEISNRIDIDTILSAAISSNITSINDIRKNMRGGLNYQDTLCIDIKYSDGTPINTISSLIYENISRKTNDITDIQIESLRLREGFFYVLVADNKTDRRILDGHELEYGDWLIIKNNTILSDLTSADVNIFDAQDYDSFRLSNDNIATGKNIFTGEISVDNNAFIKQISSLTGSIDTLSVKSHTTISSNITNISAINANIKNIDNSNLTALNSNLSNVGISNLTANVISSENIDIVYAGISNLTATDVKLNTGTIISAQITKLSATDAELINTTASTISVDFEKLINTNAQTSSSYPNALSLINKIELSIDGISSIVANEISNTVRYFGNLSTAYSQNTLTVFLHDNLSSYNYTNVDTYQFRKGFQYRITNTCTLSDNISVNILNENDYIIFNSDVVLSNTTWDTIDIIRDAETECKSLSDLVFNLSSELSTLSGELYATSSSINISVEDISANVSSLSTTVLSISSDLSTLSISVSSISTNLTSNIDYLSSELSDYHNTLSGIDRIQHKKDTNTNHIISTDNLMITDVTEISESGKHPRYYMTMLSGTLVLKQI